MQTIEIDLTGATRAATMLAQWREQAIGDDPDGSIPFSFPTVTVERFQAVVRVTASWRFGWEDVEKLMAITAETGGTLHIDAVPDADHPPRARAGIVFSTTE